MTAVFKIKHLLKTEFAFGFPVDKIGKAVDNVWLLRMLRF
nr:MAG TPA: hypothetical protein [Caudoviricetes sp.]